MFWIFPEVIIPSSWLPSQPTFKHNFLPRPTEDACRWPSLAFYFTSGDRAGPYLHRGDGVGGGGGGRTRRKGEDVEGDAAWRKGLGEGGDGARGGHVGHWAEEAEWRSTEKTGASRPNKWR